MGIFKYTISLIFIQITAGQTNGVNSPTQINLANQNVRLTTNGAALPRGLANGMPITNQFTRNMAIPGNGLAYGANMNLMNTANMVNANQNTAQANMATGTGNMGYIANQNSFNTNLANMNFARGYMATPNTANIPKTNLASGNFLNANMANANLVNSNLANSMLANANIANTNLAGIGNVATANLIESSLTGANLGNQNLPNTVANANLLNNLNPNLGRQNFAKNSNAFPSNGPAGQSFGIHILADALEVGGSVAIAGKMPIYGTVALTGNLPTDGSAAVSYNCA